MAKTKKAHRDDYDDEHNFKNRKHPRHASNQKGKGMRVINSYVEEDLDELDDYIDDEEIDNVPSKTKTKFIHKLYSNTI
jgi:hypothetical protein